LIRDVAAIVVPTVVGAALLHSFLQWPSERTFITLSIGLLGLMLVAIAVSGSSAAKGMLYIWRSKIGCPG
jgi:hypothetical protein